MSALLQKRFIAINDFLTLNIQIQILFCLPWVTLHPNFHGSSVIGNSVPHLTKPLKKFLCKIFQIIKLKFSIKGVSKSDKKSLRNSVQQSDLYRPVINPQKIAIIWKKEIIWSRYQKTISLPDPQKRKISSPSIFPFQPPVDCLQKKINQCNIDAEILLFNNFGSLLIGGIIKKYQFLNIIF